MYSMQDEWLRMVISHVVSNPYCRTLMVVDKTGDFSLNDGDYDPDKDEDEGAVI